MVSPWRLTEEGLASNIEVEVSFKSRGFSMDIADVAKRAGVPASTLRFYEKRGLIASVGPEGVRRQFAPRVLDQLALIALGQAAGLSLDEIRSMLSPQGGPNIDRKVLAAKAQELDATARQLGADHGESGRRGRQRANGRAADPARAHDHCAIGGRASAYPARSHGRVQA